MALAATTIWEVQAGGNDTNNGGAFDPGQTAGMFTDGAATSATSASPVFTSASYNFVAGDVGAWVYIASGTNWTPGWYKIDSVAANAATLNATSGLAVLKSTYGPSTSNGCATVASPTSATWSIDYSQQAGSQFTYTDLSSTGVGLTASSAAKPFGKQQVGNSIVVTGGTNFTTGRYVLASVSGTTGTFLGAANLHTGAGTDSDGAGRMGGALASPGQAGAPHVADNWIFIATGSYTVTSASANVAAGCLSTTGSGAVQVIGYASVRGDYGTRPTVTASGISTATLITLGGNASYAANLILDGANLTSIRGISSTSSYGLCYNITAQNCTNSGFVFTGTHMLVRCYATGCSTQPAIQTVYAYGCEASGNTVSGFSTNQNTTTRWVCCLSYNNSGASSDGFVQTANGEAAINCTAYNNGRDGFRNAGVFGIYVNCIAESNGGWGFNNSGPNRDFFFDCATFSNSSGSVNGIASGILQASSSTVIAGASSFFTNAAGGDFSLNNTVGAGATLRAAGYPGTFLGGTTIGYLDIGAVQHRDPGAVIGGGVQFMRGSPSAGRRRAL